MGGLIYEGLAKDLKEAEELAADAFGAACSTMEFHAPQAGQRPAHFAVSLPHSVQ